MDPDLSPLGLCRLMIERSNATSFRPGGEKFAFYQGLLVSQTLRNVGVNVERHRRQFESVHHTVFIPAFFIEGNWIGFRGENSWEEIEVSLKASEFLQEDAVAHRPAELVPEEWDQSKLACMEPELRAEVLMWIAQETAFLQSLLIAHQTLPALKSVAVYRL